MATQELGAIGGGKLSTWVKPGSGGVMGDDATKALAWVRRLAQDFETKNLRFAREKRGSLKISSDWYTHSLIRLNLDSMVDQPPRAQILFFVLEFEYKLLALAGEAAQGPH